MTVVPMTCPVCGKYDTVKETVNVQMENGGSFCEVHVNCLDLKMIVTGSGKSVLYQTFKTHDEFEYFEDETQQELDLF